MSHADIINRARDLIRRSFADSDGVEQHGFNNKEHVGLIVRRNNKTITARFVAFRSEDLTAALEHGFDSRGLMDPHLPPIIADKMPCHSLTEVIDSIKGQSTEDVAATHRSIRFAICNHLQNLRPPPPPTFHVIRIGDQVVLELVVDWVEHTVTIPEIGTVPDTGEDWV
jgi:hypothetical protein